VHLADLLVAMAVFGVVSAGMFTVLDESLRAYTIGAARAESQQSGRVAVERLAGEIRAAGRGPRAAAFSAIAVAEPTRIVLQHDLDGDGVIAGPGETITWRLTGVTLRRDAGGGAQPVIDGVRRFALEYLDAADRAAATADEARTVVITLTTEAAWELADRSVVTTYSTRVRLRNR
jgi:type II secretory pathway component PulJ